MDVATENTKMINLRIAVQIASELLTRFTICHCKMMLADRDKPHINYNQPTNEMGCIKFYHSCTVEVEQSSSNKVD